MDRAQANSFIQANLYPGETLLWAERADPWSFALRSGRLLGSLFCIAATAFLVWATFFGRNRLVVDGRDLLGFVCAWLTLPLMSVVGGILLRDCWRTTYAVTNRRLFAAVGGSRRTRSLELNKVGDIFPPGIVTFGGLVVLRKVEAANLFDYLRIQHSVLKPRRLPFTFYGIKSPGMVEAIVGKHAIG